MQRSLRKGLGDHRGSLPMQKGVPRYGRVLAQTDTAHCWRELKDTSGAIIDVQVVSVT